MLANLFHQEPADVTFPWEHPHQARFRAEHQELLHHGRLFSELMYGAALLYNLMLAERAQNKALIDEHQQNAQEWIVALDLAALAIWSLNWAEDLAMRHQQQAWRALDFSRSWLKWTLATEGRLFERDDARNLIRDRETKLKGPRSRFTNQRALDQWSGYAGLIRMEYRWSTVKQFVQDLHQGLTGDTAQVMAGQHA